MRLAQARAGDAHEATVGLDLGDRGGTQVEHGLVQAADELIDHRGEGAGVGHLALDALGDDLVVGGDVGLEIAVLGVGLAPARAHRAERAHAAVALELLAVGEHDLTGGLLAAGQQGAEHDGVGAGHEGLADVARVLQAAVRDERDSGGAAGLGGQVDGGDLGDADARDDAGGADRAGAHADLDGVDARVDERLRALGRGDVAADDVDARKRRIGLDAADHVEGQLGAAVRGVDDQDVHAGFGQGGGALPGVAPVADGSADDEAAARVLRGVGVLLGLDEVLDGDEAGQVVVVVDDGQLFDAVLSQQVLGVLTGDANLADDEAVARGHAVAHAQGGPFALGDEAQVAVGDDAQERAVLVHDGQAGDAVVAAEAVEFVDGRVGADGDRVFDHAGFAALDLADLRGLFLDGEVAVQDADAALAGHGDGHARFGDGVHGGGQERHAQGNVLCQAA